MPNYRVLCFATKGAGTNEESRIIDLLAHVNPTVFPFDRARKRSNVLRLLRQIRAESPTLVVMEGTGVAGGAALMAASLLWHTPYIVSSGDAVGPFLGGRRRSATLPGWLYEFLLYQLSAGFIGWTPYLAGRALTMGAPRAMTAANYTLHAPIRTDRSAIRDNLGIDQDALVFGLVGALNWNSRHGYCYGLELIEALKRMRRDDVAVLIVGGGSGLGPLMQRAGTELGRRVFLPGPVPHDMVTSYLSAMDVGSLPQTANQVGAFRYTTKISEYASSRLPFITAEIPVAYDLVMDWAWRVPGATPWSDAYVDAIASLMTTLSHEDIGTQRARIPDEIDAFALAPQQRRVAAFVTDVLRSKALARTPGASEERGGE